MLKTGTQLRDFSSQQMNFLQGFGEDVMDIAKYFDIHIGQAREELSFAKRKLLSVSEEASPVSDPFQGDGGNEEELLKATIDVARFTKKLKILISRKKEFLADPLQYRACQTCGRRIPLERMKEVPHCRHCVRCKNNTHNGNGK